ncbi:MAG: tetratricopeptide repeat protein [Acidobacteriota bacterium]
MNKDQLQFLVSGILFGFLVGYIIAYAVHEPQVVQHAAPVPAAGNMGMGQSVPSAGGGAAAGDSGGGGTEGGNDQMMARVFEEITVLKAAIEKDPKDVKAIMRLANMYHDARKFDQAVDLYRKALEITPRDVDARTDMGICLYEMGMADEAIAQFRTSLQYGPKHWQTWLNLGIVSLSGKNDVETASEAFAKVEEINPGFKDLPMLKDALKKASAASRKDS